MQLFPQTTEGQTGGRTNSATKIGIFFEKKKKNYKRRHN